MVRNFKIAEDYLCIQKHARVYAGDTPESMG